MSSEMPALIVALSTLVVIGLITHAAIRQYKSADEALKIVTTMIGVFGAVIGAFGTYFFTRPAITAAQSEATKARKSASAAETKIEQALLQRDAAVTASTQLARQVVRRLDERPSLQMVGRPNPIGPERPRPTVVVRYVPTPDRDAQRQLDVLRKEFNDYRERTAKEIADAHTLADTARLESKLTSQYSRDLAAVVRTVAATSDPRSGVVQLTSFNDRPSHWNNMIGWPLDHVQVMGPDVYLGSDSSHSWSRYIFDPSLGGTKRSSGQYSSLGANWILSVPSDVPTMSQDTSGVYSRYFVTGFRLAF